MKKYAHDRWLNCRVDADQERKFKEIHEILGLKDESETHRLLLNCSIAIIEDQLSKDPHATIATLEAGNGGLKPVFQEYTGEEKDVMLKTFRERMGAERFDRLGTQLKKKMEQDKWCEKMFKKMFELLNQYRFEKLDSATIVEHLQEAAKTYGEQIGYGYAKKLIFEKIIDAGLVQLDDRPDRYLLINGGNKT